MFYFTEYADNCCMHFLFILLTITLTPTTGSGACHTHSVSLEQTERTSTMDVCSSIHLLTRKFPAIRCRLVAQTGGSARKGCCLVLRILGSSTASFCESMMKCPAPGINSWVALLFELDLDKVNVKCCPYTQQNGFTARPFGELSVPIPSR